jgi:4-hydroxy-tetrahydrodipicolinate reductase
VLWSPNITIGINFLLLAAKVLRNISPSSDVEILEEHFRNKSGVSGTAQVIARELGVPADEIKSLRAGGIIGRHEILFGFPYQTVRLIHESISREAFGNGAIFAVKHLVGKPAGLYSMEDLLRPYLSTPEPQSM